LKLGVCISTNPAKFEAVPFKGDFVRNVAAAREIGFDGVELAIRDPRAIDQDLVLRTILDAGMEIPAIGTGQAWGEEGLSFTDPDPEIRAAAIERVHSHFGFARRARRWMLEAFRDCCEEAAKQGVRIAFEPINRYETSLLNNVADGLAFIDQVGADNLGMLLDTFHMNIEEPSIEGSIRLAGDRIFHVHCADSNRWYPGAGHLDFPSMVATLSSVGYGGYLSGEHRSDPDPVTASRNGLLHIRRALDMLRI
jgi:sugar phosphate isomerase/epimerase